MNEQKPDDVLNIINKLISNKNSFLHFNHLLAGLENIAILSYMSLDKTEDVVSAYRLSDIFSIINSVDNPVVFSQGKLYRSIKNELIEKVKYRTLYIFMQNSFVSSFGLISTEFSSSIFMIIPEGEYDIVAICNSNHVLIQIVIKGLVFDIRNQLSTCNIKPATIIETTQFNYQEIRRITRALFTRSNLALDNKSYGFLSEDKNIHSFKSAHIAVFLY